MKRTSYNTLAVAMAGFNALTAILGGLAVESNYLSLPISWLSGSVFANYTIPGLILLFIVGGSSLVATIDAMQQRSSWPYSSVIAALVMIGWIVGEVAIINQFNWLHILFLITGATLFLSGFVAIKQQSNRVEV